MPQSIRPGDVLAGRYRLVDLLVESRGGRFYRAHDRVLERQVAVHVLAADDDRATALVEAARRSATVPDRRLLRVLDADRADGICFVVNEWGSGTSLDRWLAADGPLTAREAAWLVAEVADTIATAHLRRVAHGRLAPENVLVDRNGGVRIIGFCVEAALHGLHDDHTALVDTDVTDLAGLLYAALTGRWAGRSVSAVPSAPREHGRVLRPRQVRAGIPRPLDTLCDEVLNTAARGRSLPEPSAQLIADTLLEFVGDPSGISEGLAERNPAGRSPETVALSPLTDPPARGDLPAPPDAEPTRVVDLAADTGADAGAASPGVDGPGTDTGDDPGDDPGTDTGTDPGADTGDTGADAGRLPADPPPPDRAAALEQPTEAGMPVFGDDTEDVSWLRARSTPPPPPPPLEEPPAKPLFAPEPEGGWPARPPRPALPTHTGTGAGFWPWDTSTGRGTGTGLTPVTGEDDVPGRRWLLLASGIALALVVLLAVVVAYNLGRGRTPLGAEPDDEQSTGSPTPTSTPTPITGLVATDLDPQGDDGEENPEVAALAVDGDPATSWRTSTYLQNFGPSGLKTGVGLVIDLGAPAEVSSVDLTFVGDGTGVSLYLTEDAPAAVADLDPVAEVTAAERERVPLDEPTTGRYLTVWLTSLPAVPDGFRGEVAEVVVRG